jgi:alkylation response protein AidB-like acyl-CoA dehydrogenase
MSFDRQAASLARQIEHAPFTAAIRAALGSESGFDVEGVDAILREAARYAETVLSPRDAQFDADGCELVDGRVHLPDGYREAYGAYVDGGWPALGLPTSWGGLGLPKTLMCACDEIFNRAGAAFMMFPNSGRSAARLLESWGDGALKAEWMPRLVSGEWGATICISEPDAGSDAGRIRTRAEPRADGLWELTGEKCWISYGDQDVTPRNAHFVLARTPAAPVGGRGLSLFMVPDILTGDDGAVIRNSVTVRRLEEKLGLHASPTCALGFEGAVGHLLGAVGRGLSQLFTMIEAMRLFVGAQGSGVAAGASEAALQYAQERRQGGNPEAPPVPIARHNDVRRQLLSMSSRAEVARGLVLATAGALDLAELPVDRERREEARALLQWFLPILKHFASETGFNVASDAIRLFGGAGYTRDWPIERYLRDARVFAIYEGTTGMQALDLLQRRLWKDDGAGLAAFLRMARADMTCSPDTTDAQRLERLLKILETTAKTLSSWRGRSEDAEAGAVPFLDLAALAATGWIALRLTRIPQTDSTSRRLGALGRFWLSEAPALADAAAELAVAGNQRLSDFDLVVD